MPTFAYKAVTTQNQIVNGSLAAPSKSEVSIELTKQGLQPITIKEEVAFKSSQSTVPAIEKITFCRYVSTMLSSGLSLSEGISVLKEETKHPVMKQILNEIIYNLEQGRQISQALALYPKVFDKFFISLIKAGEISGTMADSFKYLEEWLHSEYSLSQKIKGALIYPIIILVAMFGIGSLMVFFIMPQIGKVFLSMTIPIPALTKSIFQMSLTLSAYRFVIMGGLAAGMVLVAVFLKMPVGKRLVMKAIAPMPIIKDILLQIDIARFCRIFSTLIASAVPVTESLDISLNSLTHPRYRSMAALIVTEVTQGKTIAQTFRDHQVFPPLLIQMIAGGEKSGTLDATLKDLAAFYEEEVEEAVKKSTELLEPILMLVVGIGVGGLILSIIAPMYSVIGSFSTQQ